jgi:hypothetical protein
MHVSTNSTTTAKKRVKLEFLGFQQMLDRSRMALWTLCEEIDNHPAYSTLSEKTLFELGIDVPDPTGWKRGDIFDETEKLCA